MRYDIGNFYLCEKKMKKIYELLFRQIKRMPSSQPEARVFNTYYKSNFYMCKNIEKAITENIKPNDVFPYPIKIQNKKLLKLSNILDIFGGNSLGTLFFIFIVWQIMSTIAGPMSNVIGITYENNFLEPSFWAVMLKSAFIWSLCLNCIGFISRTIIKTNIKKQFSLNFKNKMLKESFDIVEGLTKINGQFIDKNIKNSNELLEFIGKYNIDFISTNVDIKIEKQRLEKYITHISYNFDKNRKLSFINPFDLAKEKMASEILKIEKNMLRKNRNFFEKIKEESLKVKKITKEEKSEIDFNNQLEHLKNKIEQIKTD